MEENIKVWLVNSIRDFFLYLNAELAQRTNITNWTSSQKYKLPIIDQTHQANAQRWIFDMKEWFPPKRSGSSPTETDVMLSARRRKHTEWRVQLHK